MTVPALSIPAFDRASLYFLPLGGAGEIGMNLNLYYYGGQWLMVDLGVSFGNETTPGIEIILPDTSFIEERLSDLAGLIITHAHEDHIGAVAHLWEDLRCPVYCSPFAARFLKMKLVERGLQNRVPVHVIPLGGRQRIGSFDIELLTLTHSILEPNALIIRTAAGTILHTGDWKLDPNPILGQTVDEAALRCLGDEGVDAMVCDSTNALVPGVSGSEAAVRDSLIDLFGSLSNGRIAVTCFASNAARLHSIAMAAAAHGRDVALVGRSLHRINEAARDNGYLTDLPPFVSERDAGFLPRDKAVLICTGSQGEPRAALARIAGGHHPDIVLEEGDTVIFSAREIPGNEKAITTIKDQLSRRGIRIITSDDALVHVSGHPARDELAAMYQWARPRLAIPVHGERRHLLAHAELAMSCQTPQAIVPHDGAIIRIAPGPAAIIGQAQAGKLCIDGRRIVPLESAALKGRVRMSQSGAAFVSLAMNARGDVLGMPKVTLLGLLEDDEMEEEIADLADLVRDAVIALSKSERQDDQAVRDAARLAVRRALNASQGRKPMTEVHLARV
jgi:ribonuclease J